MKEQVKAFRKIEQRLADAQQEINACDNLARELGIERDRGFADVDLADTTRLQQIGVLQTTAMILPDRRRGAVQKHIEIAKELKPAAEAMKAAIRDAVAGEQKKYRDHIYKMVKPFCLPPFAYTQTGIAGQICDQAAVFAAECGIVVSIARNASWTDREGNQPHLFSNAPGEIEDDRDEERIAAWLEYGRELADICDLGIYRGSFIPEGQYKGAKI